MLASTPSKTGKAPSVFLEAKRLGHLLKDTNGDPIVMSNPVTGVPYGQIDYFSEEAFAWWVRLLRCNVMMACDGDNEGPLVHGWMHDYGEQSLLNISVPPRYGMGSDVHNLYTRKHA